MFHSYLAASFAALATASDCNSLRDWGAANNIIIGSQFKYDEMQDDPEYRAIHQREMAIAVAGNSCKASIIQKERGVFDVHQCAKLLQDATEADQLFRFHVLVWYNQ